MTVKKPPQRAFPDVSAKNGDVSGEVRLAARSVAPKAVYHWEHSMPHHPATPPSPGSSCAVEIPADYDPWEA
ncbi:MAG TPA: hypothetical protein VE093_13520 [Polyangiaceae bacterium]|jgi:hypothetical protein|nr:hypothetical protein [Polyangiaceae bacterium]